MKHETVKEKVNPKSKTATKSKNFIEPAKTSVAAKKSADKKSLTVEKQSFVKKVELAKNKLAANFSTQKSEKKAVKTVSNISTKIVKNPKVKLIVSVNKVKPEATKIEPKALKSQDRKNIEKTAAAISVKTTEVKVRQTKTNSRPETAQPAAKPLETIVSAKIKKPAAEIKKAPAKKFSPAAKTLLGEKKLVSISDTEIKLKTRVKPVQHQAEKIEAAPANNTKAVEAKIELTNLPIPKPLKKKKLKPISSAVFRGKKDRYSFEVFDLTEEFEPVPAVFVISRRKTDRLKKAHHSLVCIGQTNSIFDELKKHHKGKCVKKHQANVVSILPEENEKIRLRIENDLKAAHSVVCSFDQINTAL